MTASEADLCRLAAIVTADRADLPAQGLPLSLLSDLMDQIRCDFVQFQGFDSRRQGYWFIQGVPDEGDDEAPGGDVDRAHWRHYWDSAPCSSPRPQRRLRSVVKIADFYSARQWHSTGMYADVYRPQGLEYELQLCLPSRRGLPADRPTVGCTSSASPARTSPTRPRPAHPAPPAPAPRLPRRRAPPRPGLPAHPPAVGPAAGRPVSSSSRATRSAGRFSAITWSLSTSR